MKSSSFITTVSLNDPDNPGTIINLSVHAIDGGYIGIDSNFIGEVANYIINPYQTTQLIRLNDGASDDETYDPPTDDDTYYGFVKLLHSFDVALSRGTDYDRKLIMDEVERTSGIPADQIDVLLGFAQQILQETRDDE